mmetsp:Transcript_103127/g.298345  ORF Transcript_103127/g.298345 Transcript_103127/m.298345 type:complete len:383 (-) Transcript_103127:168-1316(-)
MAGRKVFVGSLPDNVQESALRDEFSKYGVLEDLFVKPGCEPGRQWAMVTYSSASEAQSAKEATDRILQLPGSSRPVEVMIARNQGKAEPGAGGGGEAHGPKKIFVGSLPDSITETALREEFSKYGQISDLYLKTGCERNKQWAFITFTGPNEAETAKSATDRVLKFPDAEVACEVMLARNQGMNGRDPLKGVAQQPMAGLGVPQGPTKIFVGSLPDDINETLLRAEFSKYGQIMDVYLKTGCEPNKQWAFVIFATNAQAQHAKDATDRRLTFPGAPGPCEVMFAKFQGKNGTDPLAAGAAQSLMPAGQPPGMPPMGALPPQYAWRVYQTPQGLAYYHNHTTGVTQWECPPELHYPPVAMPHPGMYGAAYPMSPAPALMYRPY